jgi:hypothetical protein
MGKIEISEDLRNKLNKVLSYKSVNTGDTAIGPAPSWKPHLHQPPQMPQQMPPQMQQQMQQQMPPQQMPPQMQQQMPPQQMPPQMQQQMPPQQMPPQMPPQYYYAKPEKNKKKKDKIKYYKIIKVVFLSSVVSGIGLTLGLKIANILFF